MEDLEIWTSDSSDDFGIVEPFIISDFAIDVQLKPIEFDRLAAKKPPRAETVSVELILDKSEFSRLALTCPGYNLLTDDECSSVIIAKQDAQRLGIFHGTIVELKPMASADSQPLKKVKQAIALVVDDGHFPTNMDTVEVKMLPVLWFNICPIPLNVVSSLSAVQPRQCLLSRIQVASEASCTASFAPAVKYASEVVVSCIKSPQYSDTASHDTLLKTYFAKPRLLQVGDVFGIHSAVDPLCFEPIPEGSEVRNPVIYFQVKTLRTSEKRPPGSCFVDCHHSQLLQESSVNGYIPSAMSYYFGAASCLSNWSQKLLPVFQDYVGSLSNIFQPFFTSRNRYGIYPIVLLSGPPGSGLKILTHILASLLSMHHYRLICSNLLSDTAAAAEVKINRILQTVAVCSPCVLHLDGIELVGKDRDGNDDSRVTSYFISTLKKVIDDSGDWPIIVIATSSSVVKVSNDIYQCFLHCVKVEVLDERRRLELLKSFLADEPLAADVHLSHVAQRSAGMVLDDFIMLLSHVKQFAFRRHRAQNLSSADDGGSSRGAVQLVSNDFEMALDQMQLMHSEAIGAPKIPTVTWDDVGGLAKVKKDILDTVQLPLQHPELLNLGLRRSGVLLYGPPGTGKTLLAKAVATECSLNFLSVKGPELLNMYIGQSEENVRLVFERARSASPCVIFFDELDSLAPNRGRSGDSGGVMDRIVSQLLTELDGLHKSHSVFVIGATNRPDLLDPALLRPGRFDKLVYVGISDDKESQLKILKALTRKFVLTPECKLENIVERCPMSLTGADLYALASDAMLNAIRRRIEEIESGGSELTDEEKLEVSASDFLTALDNLVPSLSTADLQRYAALQKHYAIPVKSLT